MLHSSIDIFFIIDNSSNDSLREFASLSDKIVYIHSDNLGFGSGHNIAIRRSIELGAQYHAVINPDIYWEGDVAKPLAGFMDKHLCKLLPTPMDLFGRRFIPFNAYQEKHDAWFELHHTGYDKVMEVPSLSGCFMFMRVETLKQVGGFDERFFMYAEDLDLCRRIGEALIRIESC